MKIIHVKVQNRIAKLVDPRDVIVCENSDYVIRFDFDKEWGGHYSKTARFCYAGKYVDIPFNGIECEVPVLRGADSVSVGVFTSDIKSSTPVVIECQKSILSLNGHPDNPDESVYDKLLDAINKKGSVIYAVTETPSNSLGVTDDWALNTATYDMYKKTSTGWVYQCNFKGTAGISPTFEWDEELKKLTITTA